MNLVFRSIGVMEEENICVKGQIELPPVQLIETTFLVSWKGPDQADKSVAVVSTYQVKEM